MFSRRILAPLAAVAVALGALTASAPASAATVDWSTTVYKSTGTIRKSPNFTLAGPSNSINLGVVSLGVCGEVEVRLGKVESNGSFTYYPWQRVDKCSQPYQTDTCDHTARYTTVTECPGEVRRTSAFPAGTYFFQARNVSSPYDRALTVRFYFSG